MKKTEQYRNFSTLVRRHERLIVTLCLRYIGRGDTPEDLAQEVRIGLWQHFLTLRGDLPRWQEPFWVYWRTRSILSHRRRKQRPDLVSLNDTMLNSIVEESDSTGELIDELAERLDSDDRRLLDLLRQGYDSTAIAAIEGCTESAVRRRRQQLVEHLGRRAEELGMK